MLTKMRVQVARWVVRPAMAATTTEVATLATFLATMAAWHGRPTRGLPRHHGVSHTLPLDVLSQDGNGSNAYIPRPP